MAYYYVSKDPKKGEVLDELAREILGRYSQDAATGNRLMRRIRDTFPAIEAMLRGEVREGQREAFKSAARNLNEIVRRTNMPAPFLQALADAPDLNLGRLRDLSDYILSARTHSSLDLRKLYPPLERLVRSTGSFSSLEQVVGTFNRLVDEGELIPEYVDTVASLHSTGWNIGAMADIMSGCYRALGGSAASSVRALVETLPQGAFPLLQQELGLLAKQGKKETAQTSTLRITEQAGSLVVRDGVYGATHWGLYLGIAGALALRYELNAEASEAKLFEKRVTDGTFLIFKDGERSIMLEQGADFMRIENLSKDELQGFLLELQESAPYLTAAYAGIDALGQVSGVRHLAVQESGKRSSTAHRSQGLTVLLTGIDLKRRAVEEVTLQVNTPERAALYEEVIEAAMQPEVPASAAVRPEGVHVTFMLKDYPMASEKQSIRALLETVDHHIEFEAESGQSSLLETLCYLNSHVPAERIPELLKLGAEKLSAAGGLFLYPKTFSRSFERMQPEEQRATLRMLFALEPGPELAEARQWLTANYRDLLTEHGLGR
ncbi:hypothetical protein J4439_01095 [Candidatus Woesearchaeota archaeon]|nr:hypothetical protein [Candidatus Woesearchaeota archaeon]